MLCSKLGTLIYRVVKSFFTNFVFENYFQQKIKDL